MKGEREHLPKLEPGDQVPKTGKYRLEEGVRVKPVRGKQPRATKAKSGRLKKVKISRSRRR